jgi:hypothetical protein
MVISESELLKVLQAIQNQQDLQARSWVRWRDVAMGPYGPDDEDRLKLIGRQPGIEQFIDTQVRLAPDGETAVSQGTLGEREDVGRPPSQTFNPNNPFSGSWLMGDVDLPVGSAVFSGDGPFSRKNLKAYLNEQFGIDVGAVGGDLDNPELLILGRHHHQAGVVESFLEDRQGTPLLICSQEMLLSWIYTGWDPNRHPESLDSFIDGHPALERVRETLSDRWPEPGEDFPSVSSGSGEMNFNAEVEEGPLRRMGYKVGNEGERTEERRKILEEVFTIAHGAFPGTYPLGYLDSWGQPESGMRLEKMANSIATFCRNHKRRSNRSQQAINDWEADLKWLKKNFYHPTHFSFDWPTT